MSTDQTVQHSYIKQVSMGQLTKLEKPSFPSRNPGDIQMCRQFGDLLGFHSPVQCILSLQREGEKKVKTKEQISTNLHIHM